MFELIFGLIWTALSSLFAFMVYSNTGGTITVNGEVVSQAEFNEMLGPKLFVGLFLVIGLVMIVLGLKKILANAATSTKGRKTYGIVVDVYPSGSRVNGRSILNADVIIVEESGITGRYTESIGMDYNKYRPGDFVQVKHYKKDINILNKAESHTIPYNIKVKLEAESGIINSGFNDYNSNEYNVGGTSAADTVIINGVEYVKKK